MEYNRDYNVSPATFVENALVSIPLPRDHHIHALDVRISGTCKISSTGTLLANGIINLVKSIQISTSANMNEKFQRGTMLQKINCLLSGNVEQSIVNPSTVIGTNAFSLVYRIYFSIPKSARAKFTMLPAKDLNSLNLVLQFGALTDVMTVSTAPVLGSAVINVQGVEEAGVNAGTKLIRNQQVLLQDALPLTVGRNKEIVAFTAGGYLARLFLQFINGAGAEDDTLITDFDLLYTPLNGIEQNIKHWTYTQLKQIMQSLYQLPPLGLMTSPPYVFTGFVAIDLDPQRLINVDSMIKPKVGEKLRLVATVATVGTVSVEAQSFSPAGV